MVTDGVWREHVNCHSGHDRKINDFQMRFCINYLKNITHCFSSHINNVI